MSVISQVIGNTVVQWQEEEPLMWEMCETLGKSKHTSEIKIAFDLTPLLCGYNCAFLLALKEAMINKRLKVSLISIKTEYLKLKRLLQICQDRFLMVCKQQAIQPVVFERIDSELLLGLSAFKAEVPSNYRKTLRAFYTEQRDNCALFSPDLYFGDFPTHSDESYISQARRRVIGSAMSRPMLVAILNINEAAYETGTLDLARYAFSRLMLSRAARPETYRVLRCKDLRVNTSGGTKSYYLTLTIPKTGAASPPKATVSIHREVGLLLEKQREAVTSKLSHLLAAKNAALGKEDGSHYTVDDLPLFPLVGAPSMLRKTTIANLAMHTNSGNFIRDYVAPLKKLTGKGITCNVIRHTMATQLAIAGCSARTIAAVLLHTDDKNAQVYVDLIFEGAIDELSDSMVVAFNDHFPVFKEFVSAKDAIEPQNRIVSYSVDRTRHETTGACGRHRICVYAPISCYDCHRFRPCFDADHTINLDLVNEEIEAARTGGLQRQTDVKRYSHIANRIRSVIHVCELRYEAMKATHIHEGAPA